MSAATWAEVELRELIVEGPTNGYSPPSDPGATGTLTLRLSATTSGRFVLNESTTKRIHETIPAESKFWLRPGDILIQRANTLEYVGTTALYDGPPKTYIYPDLMMRIRPRETADPAYLTAYLNAPQTREALRARATGTAGNMPKVNAETVRSTVVRIPPIEEQRRIVAKLEALQARSRRARQALDAVPPLLERLRQSILAAAFRGDLTKEWRAKNKDVEPGSELLKRIRIERRKKWEEAELAKMKAKGKAPKDDKWKAKYKEPEPVDTAGLPELPEGWCWASVEELATKVVDGVHKKPVYVSRGIPFLTVKNLTAGPGISFENVNYVTEQDHEEFTKRTDPEKGDILISKDGTLGVTRLVLTDDPFSIFVSLALVKPVRRDMGSFLEMAFCSPVFQGRFKATGSGLQHIHLVDLRNAALPLAPVVEQAAVVERIAAALGPLDRLLGSFEQVGANVDSLESAILGKAFRGELVERDSSAGVAPSEAINEAPASAPRSTQRRKRAS